MKNQVALKLCPGDLVEVKSASEILVTLDADGTSDRLPFMPEMIGFCGKRFRVAKRVLKTCYYTKLGAAGFRKFKSEDVVLLDGVRCSGSDHDGCQKGCTIFWRDQWLRKVDGEAGKTQDPLPTTNALRARLKTTSSSTNYFCQASELLNATTPASRGDRLGGCFREVIAGNYSLLAMACHLSRWAFWKIRRKLLGEMGGHESPPVLRESCDLRPGDWVSVKSAKEIEQTLNGAGCNRGLYFMPDMLSACGEEMRVDRQVKKIIVDGTGEMRTLRNTVFLEGSHCGCVNSMAGCPRKEFSYWRDIWLRPASERTEPDHFKAGAKSSHESCQPETI